MGLTLIVFTLTLLVFSTTGFDLPNLGGGGGGGGSGDNKPATRNVFITMAQGTGPILAQINSQTFSSRGEKITVMQSALQNHALLTQGPLTQFLNSPAGALFGSPSSVQSSWITNQMYIRGANPGLLNSLASTFPSQIASIEDEKIFSIFPIDEQELQDTVAEFSAKQSSSTWGITKIQADKVWNQGFRGQGVRVGVIDTGVRGSHEALRGSYVGNQNYGWWDPHSKKPDPFDDHGHGTHCAGTICGTNGIGVAPQAKWMGCVGCPEGRCPQWTLVSCGEFMTCPHPSSGPDKSKQDCSKAPHIVSNSWGGPTSRDYNGIIDAWKTAGIIPVFAAGNSGPQCGTLGSPGDHPDVIGVGSTTSRDELSDFSSKGPPASWRNTNIKPDVSAPGSAVYSSWRQHDAQYKAISGTSMACPHVSGQIALMLSAKPGMTYNQVKAALVKGCVNSSLKQMSPRCKPTDHGTYRYPNSEYGQGLINSVNSVNLARSS